MRLSSHSSSDDKLYPDQNWFLFQKYNIHPVLAKIMAMRNQLWFNLCCSTNVIRYFVLLCCPKILFNHSVGGKYYKVLKALIQIDRLIFLN